MATTYKATINVTTYDPNIFSRIANVSISNAFRNIGKHFEAVGLGAITEKVVVNSGLLYGSVTFTIASGNLSANDTLTVNSTVFTAKSSGASGNQQFNIASGAVGTAQSLATCLNANPSFAALFKATYAKSGTSGVVTITALVPSSTSYTLSKSATNGTLSSTTLQGASGPVSATNVFTVAAGNLSANDTVTIGATTFTAKSSGATGAQFNIGGSALATGQALAALINSYSATAPNFSAVCTGTTTGIVTVTVLVPGTVGNNVSVTKSATNGSWSNTTFFSGGLDANLSTLNHGL